MRSATAMVPTLFPITSWVGIQRSRVVVSTGSAAVIGGRIRVVPCFVTAGVGMLMSMAMALRARCFGFDRGGVRKRRDLGLLGKLDALSARWRWLRSRAWWRYCACCGRGIGDSFWRGVGIQLRRREGVNLRRRLDVHLRKRVGVHFRRVDIST